MKNFLIVMAALLGLFATSQAALAAAKKITVSSTVFKNSGFIPAKYAFDECQIPGAENLSPELKWKVSRSTAKKIKSYAVTVIDLHPVAQNMVHLFLTDIASAQKLTLGEGVMNTGGMRNGYGLPGWGGPCPPPEDGPHIYEFTVYGLNTATLNLDTSKAYSAAEIKELLKGKIVAKGKLRGKFDSSKPDTAKSPVPASSSAWPKTWILHLLFDKADHKLNFVKKGDSVTWINGDTELHWPASNVHPKHQEYPESGGCIGSKFDACKGLAKNESYTFQFNQAGTWRWHDHLNPGIGGTITVY